MGFAYMAVSGEPYCKSAWDGFMLNLKHIFKFEFAASIAAMFVTLGKLFITCINLLVFYLLIKYGFKKLDQLNSLALPMTLIGLGSMVTAHIFLCLFDEATLATLMCFGIDIELNNGEPAFGPPTFHEKLEIIHNKHESKNADVHQEQYGMLDEQPQHVTHGMQ